MSKPWFLRRRITWAFTLTTFLLSLGLSVPFAWVVHATIQKEIDTLAREEMDETRAFFLDREPTPEDFEEVAADMCAEHPQNPLAWRFWTGEPGRVWGEFGRLPILSLASTERPHEYGLRRIDDSTRVGVFKVGNRLTAELVLRAHAQSDGFARFLWTVAGLVLVATGVATLTGGRLARRISRQLAEVAAGARTEDAIETWAPPSAIPEEIRAVVQALRDTLARIREESENTRLLISGLAHDLRSPLQNLMGETQVALLREREPSEYRGVLESQLEDLSELSRVVDNLVTLSSVDEALRRRTVESFDLGEEARLRLARERQFAARRKVDLRIEAEGPLPVQGDRESLLLALRNVVTNAIEWSPPGKPVLVTMRATGEGHEIVVDDAGPGVPPEQRDKIFRPFHRGPASQGRRVGFGLGLALTHTAVRAHGGRIEVGESPFGGARFRIVLVPGGGSTPAAAS